MNNIEYKVIEKEIEDIICKLAQPETPNCIGLYASLKSEYCNPCMSLNKCKKKSERPFKEKDKALHMSVIPDIWGMNKIFIVQRENESLKDFAKRAMAATT